MALSCEPASAVITVVALPAYLDGTPQVLVEMPAGGFISPDVAVNRFVTDGERPVFAQTTRDLFWAP